MNTILIKFYPFFEHDFVTAAPLVQHGGLRLLDSIFKILTGFCYRVTNFIQLLEKVVGVVERERTLLPLLVRDLFDICQN